jgi:hypothetical protein
VLPGQTQPVVHQSSQPFSVGLGQLAPNNPHWSGFRPDGGHGVFQPSAGYYPQLGTLAPQSIGITGPRPAQSLGGPWDGFNRDGTTNHPGGNVQSWGNQGIGSASAYVASPPPGSVTGLGPWSNGKNKKSKFESGGKSLVAKKTRGRPRKTEKK